MSCVGYLLAQKCRPQAILSNNVSLHLTLTKDVAQELLTPKFTPNNSEGVPILDNLLV